MQKLSERAAIRVTPKPHQSEAIAAARKHFATSDRGQLIMACGTGKTLTAMWIAQRMEANVILLLCPTLNLVGQAIRDWQQHFGRPFDILAVCSDASVHKDDGVQSVEELGVDVTTDPAAIAAFMRARARRPRLVIGTYQSSDRVAAAQRLRNVPKFDLAVADEAHHCAGHADAQFSIFVDARKIRAAKRLFMTATPRFFTERARSHAKEDGVELVTMDDPKRFGTVIYRISFAEAIKRRLICDYRVLFIYVSRTEIEQMVARRQRVKTEVGESEIGSLLARIGILEALKRYGLRRIITFHPRVKAAESFAADSGPESLRSLLSHLHPGSADQVWTGHVSGEGMNAERRNHILRDFSEAPGPAVLSHCQCLSEGVHLPDVDGIMMDARRSLIQIVQGVSRAMRLPSRSGSKDRATIIVPLLVNDGQDQEHAIDKAGFRAMVNTLRALSSHDERLADVINSYRGGGNGDAAEPDRADGPYIESGGVGHVIGLSDLAKATKLRAMQAAVEKPDLTEDQIRVAMEQFRALHGHYPSSIERRPIPGMPIEKWCNLDTLLRFGFRGLPGGSSLGRLVGKVRNCSPLTEIAIKTAIDEFFTLHGEFPVRKDSRPVPGMPSEKWINLAEALRAGRRGLPGGSSLAKLAGTVASELTEDEVQELIEHHHRATGSFPNVKSGRILDRPALDWRNVNHHLGSLGTSLARFIHEHFGYRFEVPRMGVDQIRLSVREYHNVHGEYPTVDSGITVPGHPQRSWDGIHRALLRDGSSLPEFLFQEFGYFYPQRSFNAPIPLAALIDQIRVFSESRGRMPVAHDREEVPGLHATWRVVQNCLRCGRRGLPKIGGIFALKRIIKTHINATGRWPTEAEVLAAINARHA